MLSSYLGWSWRIVGSDSVAVPQATAIAYLLSLVGIVSAGVARLRRGSLGLMAIPVLLSPVVMVTVPASLYADLPMGATSAAAAILLLLGIASSTSTRFFALAGVFASLCIWTKEEGLLHVAVFILAALAAAWLTRAESARWPFRAAPFLAATLPAALLYAWLRLSVIPSGATRFAADGEQRRQVAGCSRAPSISAATGRLPDNSGVRWRHWAARSLTPSCFFCSLPSCSERNATDGEAM
ncbi:MAG: hypothetical protein U5J83_15960 [Bryobacterales bacterium]|nr:hypothetical protein [Bryobacterales bacterium]